MKIRPWFLIPGHPIYCFVMVSLLGWGQGQLVFCGPAPYPPSTFISGIDIDLSTHQQYGGGSDQWVMTWADDDDIYGAWGDGQGWSQSGTKMSLGITKITKDPPQPSGTDVYGIPVTSYNWKPNAFIAVGNKTMYIFAGTDQDNWAGNYTAKSLDNGQTWNYGSQAFFSWSADDVIANGFLQFGPGYTNVPANLDANFFYIYLKSKSQATVYLARTPINDVFNRSQYEYFNGTDGSLNPIWSANYSNKKPVFYDAATVLWGHINVTYNPGIKRYLMAKTHASQKEVGIFESDAPWGPWKTIFYGQLKDNFDKFTVQFPQKWISTDGKTLWLTWSGWPEYDNVNFVKVTLTVNSTPTLITHKSFAKRNRGLAAFPNPFNPITLLTFPHTKGSPANLAIYALTGKRVASYQNLSGNQLLWNAGLLVPGRYVVTLETAAKNYSQQVILTR